MIVIATRVTVVGRSTRSCPVVVRDDGADDPARTPRVDGGALPAAAPSRPDGEERDRRDQEKAAEDEHDHAELEINTVGAALPGAVRLLRVDLHAELIADVAGGWHEDHRTDRATVVLVGEHVLVLAEDRAATAVLLGLVELGVGSGHLHGVRVDAALGRDPPAQPGQLAGHHGEGYQAQQPHRKGQPPEAVLLIAHHAYLLACRPATGCELAGRVRNASGARRASAEGARHRLNRCRAPAS